MTLKTGGTVPSLQSTVPPVRFYSLGSILHFYHSFPHLLQFPRKSPTLLSLRKVMISDFPVQTPPKIGGPSNPEIQKSEGSKSMTKTQFPLTLNRECQILARGKSEGVPYNLQAVVVHQGNSKQGHYVTLLKPAVGPRWALFINLFEYPLITFFFRQDKNPMDH